ncbi:MULTISPECIES: 50S ribosomal protein L25/general stress protein Ctc [unclassified Modestobacter]
MADFRLVAEPRTEFGKGSARRTRRAGRVPAVMYGHGQDVVHLSVPALDFAAVLRNGGSNALITITLDGKDQLVLIKAVQRDPVTRVHEHADLVVVRRGEKVTVDVPIVVTGQAAPDAISNHQLNAVSLEADATNLPESIEVDITGRGTGDNITAADLPLPAGATLITDPEALVIGFLGAPSAAELEADLGTDETEAPTGDVVPEPLDQGSGESMDAAEKSSDA